MSQPTPQTPTPQPNNQVAQMSYDLTATDEDLITAASQTFADDWRYLLDMVTSASRTRAKAEATQATQQSFSPRTG